MAIYTYKYLKEETEVTPEDIIQGPNAEDIGSPLDAIEAEVLSSHDDEVKAAMNESIEDVVSEMYIAIYESEYNYNQLMRSLGIAELNEAASGHVLVLEAKDGKSFIDRVRDVIIAIGKAIAEAAVKAWRWLESHCSFNKRLASKFEAEIKSGSSGEWSFNGFDFADIDPTAILVDDKNINFELTEIAEDENIDEIKEDIKKSIVKSVLDMNTDADFTDIQSIANLIDARFRKGGEKKNLNGVIDADKVIKILKSDDVKILKDAYNEIKKTLNTLIKNLDNISKDLDNSEDTKDVQYTAFIKSDVFKFTAQLNNKLYGVLMKAVRDRNAQARRLALMWINNTPEGKKKLEGASMQVPTSESAFSKIKLI